MPPLAAFRRGPCPNPEGAECDGYCLEPHLCALDRAMDHLGTDEIVIRRPGYQVTDAGYALAITPGGREESASCTSDSAPS